MAKRYRTSRRRSKRTFLKGAVNVNSKNSMKSYYMRGGIRL